MSQFTDTLRDLAVKSNDGYLTGPALQAADIIDRLEMENFDLLKAVAEALNEGRAAK